MISKNKFNQKVTSLGRKENIRDQKKPRMLIVCEGEKTEPNYFIQFKESIRDNLLVFIDGTGKNTLSLVDYAIEQVEIAVQERENFNMVWVVFDRDSFSTQDFNEAVSLAKRKKFNVAYSNEAFELWYLLHFDYIDSALSRYQYEKMLTERLSFKYVKNSKDMFDKLLARQETAIRNAERLLASYPNPNPETDNPSTTVHKLVIQLNGYRNSNH
jgi:hypothetical protein